MKYICMKYVVAVGGEVCSGGGDKVCPTLIPSTRIHV